MLKKNKPEISNSYAEYASFPQNTKGRFFKEDDALGRSCFQRDRDRILHSSAFRRLKGKTQVFVVHEDEDYRTRLTHTLEVSQIARSIARELRLNEDLTEALALAHDLGHSPFGHAGEEALEDCLLQYNLSFNHNAQSLKVVTCLERSYANFDGLNLSWETLEGLAKHNGPVKKNEMPKFIAEYNQKHNLMMDTYPSLEAQVAAICDDIAYDSHDIYDGLHAGLFSIDDISEIDFIGNIFNLVQKRYPNVSNYRLIHEGVRRIINELVNDVVAQTKLNLLHYKPKNADDVRGANLMLVAFSDNMLEKERQLKQFMFAHMYRHYKVRRATSKGRRIIKRLFDLYMAEPDLFFSEKETILGKPEEQRAVIVSDYIASLTDAAATEEYVRFFDPNARV